MDMMIKIALAATWNPRGETDRLQRLLPQMRAEYAAMCIVLPPDVETPRLSELAEAACLSFTMAPAWSWGRRLSVQQALESGADFIHYADLDRLLRWVEIRPDEWRKTLVAIQQTDYLVIGRTPAAYATHPQAMVQTEAISNLVTGYLTGQPMDVSAGSKGFSRRAAQLVAANTEPVRAIGADAEWTVLLKRAGFSIAYVEVDGLDWETADRYRERAADPAEQKLAAQAYDADPAHWARRVEIALEIVISGLDAAQRNLQHDSTK
jgi:hypothetical protein